VHCRFIGEASEANMFQLYDSLTFKVIYVLRIGLACDSISARKISFNFTHL